MKRELGGAFGGTKWCILSVSCADTGAAAAASTPAASSTAGSAICHRAHASAGSRRSSGSRLTRDEAAVAGGSTTTALTRAPKLSAWCRIVSTTPRRAAARSTRSVLCAGSRSTTTASK